MSKQWLAGSSLMILTLSFGACEDKSMGFKVGKVESAPCDLTLDNIGGTEWIFLRANPDKSETPDHTTRLKFESKEGKTIAKYNVGSMSSMYDYNCNKTGEEFICKEEPRVKDWCQSLAVAEGSECTADALKGIDPGVTEEQIAKGMKDAEEVIAKYKGTPDWKQFLFNNNNLGNKLQGLLYIKIDEKRCRLRITDNYMTIYNGKRQEDSNPAGTNPFVKNDQGELSWLNCKSSNLFALAETEFPAKPGEVGHQGRYEVGGTAQHWLLEEAWRVADPKCTYSFDLWVNGKPGDKGKTPDIVDGKKEKELRWGFSKTYSTPMTTPEVTLMHLKASCPEAEKEEDKSRELVACNAVLVQ